MLFHLQFMCEFTSFFFFLIICKLFHLSWFSDPSIRTHMDMQIEWYFLLLWLNLAIPRVIQIVNLIWMDLFKIEIDTGVHYPCPIDTGHSTSCQLQSIKCFGVLLISVKLKFWCNRQTDLNVTDKGNKETALHITHFHVKSIRIGQSMTIVCHRSI